MAKKPDITDEEIAAFRKAVSGVKPLVHKKIRVARPHSQPKKKISKHPILEEDLFTIDESIHSENVGSEAILSYKHPSVPDKTLRKLRKGQYNVDAILDLHGMTVEEAKEAVEKFIRQALLLQKRVVLLIHGKGHHSHMPILKNKINSWLRQLNVVLAFCSAASTHGSRGATYVLLKRTSQED